MPCYLPVVSSLGVNKPVTVSISQGDVECSLTLWSCPHCTLRLTADGSPSMDWTRCCSGKVKQTAVCRSRSNRPFDQGILVTQSDNTHDVVYIYSTARGPTSRTGCGNAHKFDLVYPRSHHDGHREKPTIRPLTRLDSISWLTTWVASRHSDRPTFSNKTLEFFHPLADDAPLRDR